MASVVAGELGINSKCVIGGEENEGIELVANASFAVSKHRASVEYVIGGGGMVLAIMRHYWRCRQAI